MAQNSATAQNSAGICLAYGAELTSAKKIPGITSIPDIGGEPESLDTTTLDNLKYTSYIAGLQDLGGSFGFEANLTPAFRDAVDAAIKAGRSTWYILFPAPLSMYYEWKGTAQPLPVTGVGVNEVLKTTLYITAEELQGPKKIEDGQMPDWAVDKDGDGLLEGENETVSG